MACCGKFKLEKFDFLICIVWQYIMFAVVSDDLFPIFLNYRPQWRCNKGSFIYYVILCLQTSEEKMNIIVFLFRATYTSAKLCNSNSKTIKFRKSKTLQCNFRIVTQGVNCNIFTVIFRFSGALFSAQKKANVGVILILNDTDTK